MIDLDVSGRVRQLVEPMLAVEGFELVDVEHFGKVLRITVDKEGGIDLDTIAEVSRRVSDELDRDDVVPGRYTLEVSSPGVERPLRTPAQFQRFVGSAVAVKTRPGTDGDRRIDGVLESADNTGVVVAGRTLRYDQIEHARTRFEWGPSARPGGPKSRKKKARPKAADPQKASVDSA